jgi:hypothetical protein
MKVMTFAVRAQKPIRIIGIELNGGGGRAFVKPGLFEPVKIFTHISPHLG